MNILILLGNENDAAETPSESASLRAQSTVEFLKKHNDYCVVTTGAFGSHFNESNKPHGRILSELLAEHGVAPERILPHIITTNTLEDAYGALRYLNKQKNVGKVHIITSSFHLERVRYIFGRVLQNYELSYGEAPNPANKSDLNKKLTHEKNAIAKLKKEWVDISNYDLNVFPSQSYENLGYEIRHYDNVSYFAIAGAILLNSLFVTGKLPESNALFFIVSVGSIYFTFILWYLYIRFANTAASARRVLKVIEKLYGVPGISSTQHKTKMGGRDLTVKGAISSTFALMIIFIVLGLFHRIFT